MTRHSPAPSAFAVCFVCTGNICRSPMAEVVLRSLAERAGLASAIEISSAGTGEWHLGEHADQRALDALERHGLTGEHHRAQLFDPGRFEELDLVVALDHGHERALRSWARTEGDRQKVRRLLDFEPGLSPQGDVPDPYYSDAAAFDQVLALIERACRSLFAQIEPGLRGNRTVRTDSSGMRTVARPSPDDREPEGTPA
ncbi:MULTISPECIES: low molecular weight protein-tyrosine-phosphatase [unclassified Rathayibacter]|uniref:low molecular weight protein-tyrosine-phosphatase n=1 Tax=unclassified Rathayibacter TaxID=2609250 RepID=UPI00188CCF4E|nr:MULTISPECIES: low molecular weight protein-tyrosine-phosphatase [unclassified Rathayibacter]MBF4461298.1 low molecular weight phosphotyrosine protein phosphatase [Rathayibacter sp. VKM Ac-2879]MBF4502709.1 low molecular weight phosphotyrosine protein phosphatase [Rathayibacter sp. VKM Ac-2878]